MKHRKLSAMLVFWSCAWLVAGSLSASGMDGPPRFVKTLEFKAGTAELTAAGQKSLQRVQAWASAHADAEGVIEGFVCEGDFSSEDKSKDERAQKILRLGKDRAQAILGQLKARGVKTESWPARSMGEGECAVRVQLWSQSIKK
jgi:outer membrane protein OmpA-like peptidoglycan-associated protein